MKILIAGKSFSRSMIRDILPSSVMINEIFEVKNFDEGMKFLAINKDVDLFISGYVYENNPNSKNGFNLANMVKSFNENTKVIIWSTIEPPSLNIFMENRIVDYFHLKSKHFGNFEEIVSNFIQNIEGKKNKDQTKSLTRYDRLNLFLDSDIAWKAANYELDE